MALLVPTTEEKEALERIKAAYIANSQIADEIAKHRPEFLALSAAERENLVDISWDKFLHKMNIAIGRSPKYIPIDITVRVDAETITLNKDSDNRVISPSDRKELTKKTKRILRSILEKFLMSQNFPAEERNFLLNQAARIASRECSKAFSDARLNSTNWKTISIRLASE